MRTPRVAVTDVLGQLVCLWLLSYGRSSHESSISCACRQLQGSVLSSLERRELCARQSQWLEKKRTPQIGVKSVQRGTLVFPQGNR